MTTVVLNSAYLKKLVFQDLKRKWREQGREFGVEDKFQTDEFVLWILKSDNEY